MQPLYAALHLLIGSWLCTSTNAIGPNQTVVYTFSPKATASAGRMKFHYRLDGFSRHGNRGVGFLYLGNVRLTQRYVIDISGSRLDLLDPEQLFSDPGTFMPIPDGTTYSCKRLNGT
jgi:hypothetical protein